MSKRIQERKMEGELAVAKPRSVCFDFNKPEPMAILFLWSGCSQYPRESAAEFGVCERSRGKLRADFVQNRVQNPETCSQVWKGDNQSQRSCGKLQRCTAQGAMPDSSRSCGELQRDYVQSNIPKSSGSCWKLQRKIEIQLQATRLHHHSPQVPDYGYDEKIFTNLRRKLKRTEDDEMFDLKTNVLFWRVFMLTTMKSATHPGLDYYQNLIACENTNFDAIKTLFDMSLKQIADNSFEILNLSTVMYDFSPWMRMACVMIEPSDGRKQRYMI